jgi:Ricin-type beta-trefoil lectin domain
LLALILASGSLSSALAQGSGDRAIDQAQRAVRERITSREGGRNPTVVFNSDTKTEFIWNRGVRIRGTGAFGRGNESSHGSDARPDGRVSYSGPIMNRRSDKALDVTGQSTQDGANIRQWGYADQANQNWEVIDLGAGEVAIISRHSGKAIAVQGGRDDNGANIIRRSWNGAPQQRWRLEQVGGDYYRIVSVGNGKCLDVTEQGKQDGAGVQLWAYANQSNQQWRLRR